MERAASARQINFKTRLLCKDEPENVPLTGKAPFSAILLGSPGETSLDVTTLSSKTSKDGARFGLQGVLRDLMLARAFLIQNMYGIFECMHGMRLFRDDVLSAMILFFTQESQPRHYVIYFSGHGNRQTGNWVFTDGEVALQDIYDIFVSYAPPDSCLSIVADCCHSGAWVEQLLSRPHDLDQERVCIQAACLRDEVCWDTSVGGMFTKSWVSGDYFKLAKRQLWEHHGQNQLEDMQSSLSQSFSSWLPWNRFLANNPALLSCSFLASSTVFNFTKECSALLSDADVEHSQHPIASHPWAFNLTFHDSRFACLPEKERFPPVGLRLPADEAQQSSRREDSDVVPRDAGANLINLSIPTTPSAPVHSSSSSSSPKKSLLYAESPSPCKYIDLKDFWLGKS